MESAPTIYDAQTIQDLKGGAMKKCFECETTEDLQEHHVIPRSKGGTKTITLCYACHMRAHGRDGKGLHFSQLMKNVFEAKKARGETLGHLPTLEAHRHKGSESNRQRGQRVAKIYGEMILETREFLNSKNGGKKVSLVKVGEYLNEQGKTTPRGKQWTKQLLSGMLKRYKILMEEQ